MTDEILSGGDQAAVEESKQQVMEVPENKENPEQVETEENKAEGEEQVKRKKPGGWHRKIARLERQNAELLEKINSNNPTATAVPDKKPQLTDYKTYDDYTEALTDWKVDQKLKARDEDNRKATEQAEKQKAATTWQQKVDALVDSEESYEDFDDVVGRFKNYKTNPAINQALAESEIGPKLAYHLAQNPDLLDEINAKTPYAVAKEMAKLEASLSNPTPQAKVSKSPPPITPGKGTVKTTVSLDTLDTSAYLARRYPNLIKKR